MYKSLIRPLLFLFPPEQVHRFVCVLMKRTFVNIVSKRLFTIQDDNLLKEINGIRFSNRVGLAAGFDKNGEIVDQLAALGFGFIEIGTVTPKAQRGNEKPRLFRLPVDEALINRMGFNNAGVEKVRSNLLASRRDCIIGGNIGKNKSTPNEQAVNDYEICFTQLFDVVDYFAINVSSPNTPGLRELQGAEPLTKILSHLQSINHSKQVQKPIFLKIAPDLQNVQLNEIIDVVKSTGISGVIATNTTIKRERLKSAQEQIEKIGSGGLSGKPLRQRSTEVIRYLYERSDRSFTIIGSGGIHSPQDAIEKIEAGASLIQLYTGFIYEGPGLIRRINERMLAMNT